MRYLRALIAALMVVGGLVAVTTGPASAQTGYSTDVDIIVRANGIVDINGDNADNRIVICQPGDLRPNESVSFDVLIFEDDEVAEIVPVTGLTKDLRINMRRGDDAVEINNPRWCRRHSEDLNNQNSGPYIPRDLRAILGTGDDRFAMWGTHVGDDATIVGGSGDEEIDIFNSSVDDFMSISTASGRSETYIDYSTFGRTSIRGGPQADIVRASFSDLGRAPRMFTNSGDDEIIGFFSNASGRANINTGNGDDIFGWLDLLICEPVPIQDGVGSFGGDGCCDDTAELSAADHGECCVDPRAVNAAVEGGCCDVTVTVDGGHGCCEVNRVCDEGGHDEPRDYYFNLNMGGGDDEAHMALALDRRDRLQGGPRNGDFLGFFGPGGARVNGFELFGEPSEEVIFGGIPNG